MGLEGQTELIVTVDTVGDNTALTIGDYCTIIAERGPILEDAEPGEVRVIIVDESLLPVSGGVFCITAENWEAARSAARKAVKEHVRECTDDKFAVEVAMSSFDGFVRRGIARLQQTKSFNSWAEDILKGAGKNE